VILELELIFASIKGKTYVPHWRVLLNYTNGRVSEMVFSPDEFETVSTSRYRLAGEGVAGDFHHFIPVIFDELHLCEVNTTVHAVLIDFCFRPKRYPAIVCVCVNVNHVNRSSKKENAPFATSKSRPSSGKLSPLSFAAFLYSSSEVPSSPV